MKIIIVGAGPSGLLLGLLLAKQGVHVQVLEASDTLDNQPRACHYAPPSAVELSRAGVLHEIHEKGFVPGGVAWRKKDGSFIAGIDNSDIPADYPFRMVCLPLGEMIEIIYRHLEKQPTAEIKMNHRATGVGQDDSKAWVVVQTPDGEETYVADYIVGCDGANSQVRRSLFGDGEFPGWSWDKQIIATNVYYPFEKFGYWDSNFIVDPNDWYMAAKITRDGVWRVTYGDEPGLTKEQYIERQPMRFEKILPGQPKMTDYKLVHLNPYKMHQRLAPKLRVGRILLAADAGHLCNPFGGLGLTGGIADVGGLYDCFMGIHKGQADESILDKYDEIRREIYKNFIDPLSTENFKRIWDQDPDKALENDEFFKLIQKVALDKELSRKFQTGIMAIGHDFTQYYTNTAS
ncbi:hypothetical protein F5884DRAFT_856961 [Xylogone sp. PMI_703]|nr:hypothetical protein F5884DRAFT_856961 [Xylogone sp. PMI_703]